ncbi:MFS transporter [Planctomicrobium sp. SH661]|uniref:MFS transporter n=1 Tax=Planctomicrobium sp. SH661 TaxID=3448124 RepID=UPI003F5B6824
MKAESNSTTRGQWAALAAAFLGWLFDGFEMGLFPLVGHPALEDLMSGSDPGERGAWMGVIHAGFLVGAATGGVVFGWLGDRIGRVRAMSLSILTYALFSGLCGFAQNATQLLILRVIASLGMGGEWSLGVSLVMEVWPSRSRGWLAGLIGAASNVGFILVAVMGMGLSQVVGSLETFLRALGLPESTVAMLLAHGGWRILMMCGALPAVLTFLVRIFVPESERWEEEQQAGRTSNWATSDLLGVLAGSLGPLGIIYLWADENIPQSVRLGGTVVGLAMAIIGYLYPVTRYLKRVSEDQVIRGAGGQPVRKLMIMGAVISGVALLGTWGSVQWAAAWASELTKDQPVRHAKEYTQIALGVGAIIGTISAAMIGHTFGRRRTYFGLCILSLTASLVFFQTSKEFGPWFLTTAMLAGGTTASFYGWLPLYLPELFPTSVRATGQGFAFNFGRILAAVGTLQTGALMNKVFNGSYPDACSVMSYIYVVGMVAIWFVPETRKDEMLA